MLRWLLLLLFWVKMCNGDGGSCADGKPAQLTIDTVKGAVIETEYAVRGPILLKALEIEQALKSGKHDFPFKEVVKCNIGNPQSLGQKPITFIRQVLSLVMNPSLLENEVIVGTFPSDVVERAKKYLRAVGSIGAYSESQGVEEIREEIADFITERDGGVQAYKENIFLSAGASEGVKSLLTILLRDERDAVLVPIPQYPLYSALTTLMGGYMAGYYMGEENGWEFDGKQVEMAYEKAVALGKTVRAIVVINPGNPTGSLLSESNMEEIVNFCREKNIVLLADEVYQANVYREDQQFISFRSMIHKMGILNKDGSLTETFQLASFHSISKGMIGECGLRGGYTEYIGFEQPVKDQVYKISSIGLCSNVPGQLALGLVVNPPKPGSPSHELYVNEINHVFESLKRRAAKLEAKLNSLPGIKCNHIEGAMYAFPLIELPKKFVEKARAEKRVPDVAYALELLSQTGLVVVPGSGFGQREGTFHFRTTFLPPETAMDQVLERFETFHNAFMQKYA